MHSFYILFLFVRWIFIFAKKKFVCNPIWSLQHPFIQQKIPKEILLNALGFHPPPKKNSNVHFSFSLLFVLKWAFILDIREFLFVNLFKSRSKHFVIILLNKIRWNYWRFFYNCKISFIIYSSIHLSFH